jgi:GTP-binding protein Era
MSGASGPYRAGFVCFVGRPNAGKSTLINAMVGRKIAITSTRPQTTRHVVRGVLHRPDAQLVLVDTPGVHRPKTLLGQRLNDLVRETWSGVDVIGLCLPADEAVGPGDRFIAAEIAGLTATLVAVVTKTDLVPHARLPERLLSVSQLGEVDPARPGARGAGATGDRARGVGGANIFADIVPVSAVTGEQLDVLVEVMASHLPVSPQLYPDDMITDEPEQVMVAELIREAALEGVRDELPHSIAVVVEEMSPAEGRDDLTRIFADIYVERQSQKSIVIGAGGSRLRDVGMRARAGIESLLGSRVYLGLHVRVAKEWQRDPRQLRKLGF